jgi:heme-degrading monooxygenase HmoA
MVRGGKASPAGIGAGGRSDGMHARVTTLEGAPDRTDDATRHFREQVLPQLQQMEGFKGFVALSDRQSGKLLGVAFWESEEALRATDEAVVPVREGAAEAAGGTVAGVEHYEVVVYEAPSAGPVSGVTDTVGGTVSGATDSVRGVTDNLLGGEKKQR